MVVTFDGISADVSDVHPWKQARGIVVNDGLVGNTTVVSDVHPLNA